jgi:hypothetical protein
MSMFAEIERLIKIDTRTTRALSRTSNGPPSRTVLLLFRLREEPTQGKTMGLSSSPQKNPTIRLEASPGFSLPAVPWGI